MSDQKKTIQERIIKYEEQFSNENKGLEIYIAKGSIPILLSTPHSVYQRRDGKIKPKEMFTGAIGRYIHETTGCHLIQSVASEFNDPNYDTEDNSLYKEKLYQIVKTQEICMVIDLHGCKGSTPYLVELGTINDEYQSLNGDKKLLGKIIDIFKDNLTECGKTPVRINEKFNAARETTITNYVNTKTNIASLQIEVNANIRDFYHIENLKNSIKLVESLSELIYMASDYFQEKPKK